MRLCHFRRLLWGLSTRPRLQNSPAPRCIALRRGLARPARELGPAPNAGHAPAKLKTAKLAKEAEQMLIQIEECVGSHCSERLHALIETYMAHTSGQPGTLMVRAALQAFFACGRPSEAHDFFRSTVQRGYMPCLEDVEVLMHGLLRHSDEVRARQLLETLSKHNLKPRTATHNLLIDFYLKEQRPDEARAIFRRLEEHRLLPNQTTYLHFLAYFVGRADYKAADTIREYMKTKRVPIDIRFYNGLLSLMGRRRAFKEIEHLISEMERAGVASDARTYDILLSSYASANINDRVQFWFDQMRQAGLSPTTKTFNRMLLCMSHTMSPEQTRAYLLEMSKQGLTFNGHTYTALISNLLKQEKYREAVEMIFELERKEIALTVECYGQILHICCARRVDPAVKLLWQQMGRKKISPNYHILADLIRYHVTRREYACVDSLLLQMKRQWDLRLNPYILAALLNHSVEFLDFVQMKNLLATIKESNIEVNSVMYNILMKAFYAYSRYQQGGFLIRLGIDAPPQEESPPLPSDQDPINLCRMQAQFEALFDLPFRPTVHIYNEILLSLLVRERFEEMRSCVAEMRKKDIALNMTTFTFLIKARIFSGDLEGAREILREMEYSGLVPTTLHCALVFHCYCRNLLVTEAEAFLREMEDCYQLKPNHVFFGSLIYAYSRRREYSRVFEVFQRMEQSGFTPDTETCNYILISLLEINEFSEARRFFEKMLLQGIKRNMHTYSYLVMGFLTRGDDLNFLSLLNDCTMGGNTIDTFPFNKLLNYFYQVDDTAQILSILLLMSDYCVQYDRETAPFISLSIQAFSKDIKELPKLCRIMKKTMVDFTDDSLGACAALCEQLEQALVDANLTDELASLHSVRERLPELRKLWTNVNDKIVESLTCQFFWFEETPNLVLPLENDKDVKDRITDIVKMPGKTVRDSVVQQLTGDERHFGDAGRKKMIDFDTFVHNL